MLGLLLALSLACGGSGDVPTPTQDTPTATPGPTSTDGPIWVLQRLNRKPVIRIWGTVLTLYTSEDSAGGYDGCNGFAGSHEDGSRVARPDGTISFPGFTRTLAWLPIPGARDAAAKTTGPPWRKRARTGFWTTDWKSETGRETSAW